MDYLKINSNRTNNGTNKMDYSKSVTWISIRNITLPESNLIQQFAYCKIPLIWCSRIGKTDLQWGKRQK